MDAAEESTEAELCHSLYEMVESASLALMCNRNMLKALKEARAKAESDMILRGASVGLSLWAAGSAFWTTSAVTGLIIAPLETWAFSELFMYAVFSSVPTSAVIGVEVTTTFWWCPPVAIPAAIVAIGCGVAAWKKKKERELWNRKIDYHSESK